DPRRISSALRLDLYKATLSRRRRRGFAGRRKVNRAPRGGLRRTISPASVGAGLPRPRWQSCHAATAEWHVVAAASRRRRNEPRRERLSWLGRGPEDSASGFERNGRR